jgi:hypothetical protein
MSTFKEYYNKQVASNIDRLLLHPLQSQSLSIDSAVK